MVAPEQREAYSSEHVITDFNSADAKRNTQSVSVASRVYYLAGIGKCTNPLEPFALRSVGINLSSTAEAQHLALRATAVE
jgi:hypothetical protein